MIWVLSPPAWFSRGHALEPRPVIPPQMIHVTLSFTWTRLLRTSDYTILWIRQLKKALSTFICEKKIFPFFLIFIRKLQTIRTWTATNQETVFGHLRAIWGFWSSRALSSHKMKMVHFIKFHFKLHNTWVRTQVLQLLCLHLFCCLDHLAWKGVSL